MGQCESVKNSNNRFKRSNIYTNSVKDNPNEEFYQVEKNAIEDISGNTLKEKIELFLGLRNIKVDKNKTYHIQVTIENKKTKQNLGTTNEKKSEKHIDFDISFIMDYYFESKQNIFLTIFDSVKNYTVETSIGNIMGAREQTLLLTLPNEKEIEPELRTFEVFLRGNSVKSNSDPTTSRIQINLVLQYGVIKNIPIFFIIKRNSSKIPNSPNWINAYKSAVTNFTAGSLYRFNQFSIKNQIICDDDLNKPILIEFYDYLNKEMIGTIVANISSLIPEASSPFVNAKIDMLDKTSQTIFIAQIKVAVESEFKFLDYLQGGLRLGLIIGVDFTASNGDPYHKQSLHCVTTKELNSYEKAIKSCGDIVAYYDYDHLFPVFGFGAKIVGSGPVVNHCFNLNFKQDPNIYLINNILIEYRSVLEQKKITLFGPTLFAPIINKAIEITRENPNEDNYQILMILTDGVINDMPETINALVEASFMAISVIIIGIGDADFTNMNILDADQEPLINKQFVRAARDLVQFVPFNDFHNDADLLSAQVLEEIPKQVVEYFKMKKISPGKPTSNIQSTMIK